MTYLPNISHIVIYEYLRFEYLIGLLISEIELIRLVH